MWAAVAVWAALGLHVSYADLRRAVIPRRAVWAAGTAVTVLLGASEVAGAPARFGWAAAGATSVGVMLDVAYRLRPDWMGFGDVRLIIVNSLLAGWWGPEWAWWALTAGALAEWPVAAVALAATAATRRCGGRRAWWPAPRRWWAFRLWAVGTLG